MKAFPTLCPDPEVRPKAKWRTLVLFMVVFRELTTLTNREEKKLSPSSGRVSRHGTCGCRMSMPRPEAVGRLSSVSSFTLSEQTARRQILQLSRL